MKKNWIAAIVGAALIVLSYALILLTPVIFLSYFIPLWMAVFEYALEFAGGALLLYAMMITLLDRRRHFGDRVLA